MKRFLYYNQDSINSLLAQIEQGLLVKDSSGKEETESSSETTSIKSDLSGDISAKVLGIGTALKGNLHGEDTGTEVTSNLIRSVQEKVLHDYAFDLVLDHVTQNGLVNNSDPQIGDIILVSEMPTFLDFNYFQTLFADNGAVRLANEQNKKNLENTINELKSRVPKGTQIPAVVRTQINSIKESVNNAETQRKDLVKTIEAIKNTLPYNRFIMTSNMLLPLDDENLRDNPNIVAFKYGGNMSIFGYVTNVVSEGNSPIRNNDFAPLYDTINQIMLNIFKNQNKVYIVHPVAIYY